MQRQLHTSQQTTSENHLRLSSVAYQLRIELRSESALFPPKFGADVSLPVILQSNVVEFRPQSLMNSVYYRLKLYSSQA